MHQETTPVVAHRNQMLSDCFQSQHSGGLLSHLEESVGIPNNLHILFPNQQTEARENALVQRNSGK